MLAAAVVASIAVRELANGDGLRQSDALTTGRSRRNPPPSIKEPAKPASAAAAAAPTSPGGKGLTGERASKVATASVKAAAAADQAKLAVTPPPPPTIPKGWADIKVGSLVIAHESVVDGWWEAIVTEINGDKLTIKWRDYPRQPTVVRGNAEIAFASVAVHGWLKEQADWVP